MLYRRVSQPLIGAILLVVFALVGSAAAEDTLAKIRRTGVVTVGTEAAFPPFEFVENGKIVGYGKDILDYIVADLHAKLDQSDVPFQGLYPGLLAGKFDFVATTLLMNPDTTKRFAFTMPFAEGSSALVKRKGDDRIKGVADLNGKIVGTQLGTGSEKTLRALDAEFRAGGKPGFDLKLFTSSPEAYLALGTSQIDAAASLLPSIQVLAIKQPGVYEVVGTIRQQKEYLGWACRPDDLALRDYISSKIRELRDSGKLYALQDKWFGFRMEIPDSGYIPAGGI